MNRRISHEEFVQECNKIHKGKGYTYLSQYTTCLDDIDILCPHHGKFTQNANNHKAGHGCLECGYSLCGGYWSPTVWKEAAEKSKYFDSFKFYVLRCFDESEEFYKIGITYTKVNRRYNTFKRLPYKYEVVFIQEFNNAHDCFYHEVEMKRVLKEFLYKPLKDFGGQTECFTQYKV